VYKPFELLFKTVASPAIYPNALIVDWLAKNPFKNGKEVGQKESLEDFE
jgi:hypothetical protein